MIDKADRAVDYLKHILQAIERIERYTADMSQHNFLASELTQDAVIRNFEIIGEASRNIDRNCPEFAAAHPDLPLLNRLRNAQRVSSRVFPCGPRDSLEDDSKRSCYVAKSDQRDT
jgi:Protein of unknown function DUF86